MLVAGETRSMTGSGYAVATAPPAAEVTFTSGGCWRQCLLKRRWNPIKSKSRSKHTRGTNRTTRGLRFLVAWDSIAPHGDANHAVFALTKTTDADDIQRMFDAY